MNDMETMFGRFGFGLGFVGKGDFNQLSRVDFVGQSCVELVQLIHFDVVIRCNFIEGFALINIMVDASYFVGVVDFKYFENHAALYAFNGFGVGAVDLPNVNGIGFGKFENGLPGFDGVDIVIFVANKFSSLADFNFLRKDKTAYSKKKDSNRQEGSD